MAAVLAGKSRKGHIGLECSDLLFFHVHTARLLHAPEGARKHTDQKLIAHTSFFSRKKGHGRLVKLLGILHQENHYSLDVMDMLHLHGMISRAIRQDGEHAARSKDSTQSSS